MSEFRRPPAPRSTRPIPAASGSGPSPSPSVSHRAATGDLWTEFNDWVEMRMQSRWVFRGSASTAFECKPGAGRGTAYEPRHERRIFEDFKREARLHVSMPGATDWDWLALAQHYGLPTRLLDWSTNPLVAAYFAVSSSPYDTDAMIQAQPLETRQLIEPATTPDPFAIAAVGFLLPSALAPRIASQKGLFSVHPDPTTAWAPPGLADNTFRIPAASRPLVQRNLFRFGIDAAHIHADLAGLCQSLTWQYKLQIGFAATLYGPDP